MDKRSIPQKRPATMLTSDRRSPPGNFGRRTPVVFDSSDFSVNNRSMNSERIHSIIARTTRPTLLPPPPNNDEFGLTEQFAATFSSGERDYTSCHSEHSAGAFSGGERDYASYRSEQVEEDDLEENPNNGKTNLKWNNKMDDVLIDALLGQMLKGQKIGTTFTSTAYNAVARAVSVNFKVGCKNSHVVNRLKTVKQNYAIIHDMMTSTSGFGYNHSTQMIENEGSVWNEYIKSRPKASKYRNAPIRNYDKLLALFGKDRATGSHAAGPKQRRRRSSYKEQVNPNIDNTDGSNNFESDLGTNTTYEDDTPTEVEVERSANISGASKHSSESRRKKSRISDILREEFMSIRGGLDNVAASLDRGNVRNYNDDDLYNEIEKVEGLSEVVVMKVYQALSDNISRARAFLSVRNDRRKLWLIVRFGRSFLEDGNVDEAFDLNDDGSST